MATRQPDQINGVFEALRAAVARIQRTDERRNLAAGPPRGNITLALRELDAIQRRAKLRAMVEVTR